MVTRPMVMVFSYDISRNRVRRKVAQILENRAVRVQKSVFEARLEEADAKNLFTKIKQELEPGDSLRMYALSHSGLRRTKIAGVGILPSDKDYWLV